MTRTFMTGEPDAAVAQRGGVLKTAPEVGLLASAHSPPRATLRFGMAPLRARVPPWPVKCRRPTHVGTLNPGLSCRSRNSRGPGRAHHLNYPYAAYSTGQECAWTVIARHSRRQFG